MNEKKTRAEKWEAKIRCEKKRRKQKAQTPCI